MSADDLPPRSVSTPSRPKARTPFHFFLRGLAISLPTILTVVILIWLARGVNNYIIYPATSAVKWVLAQALDESLPVTQLVRLPTGPEVDIAGKNYLVTRALREEYLNQQSRLTAQERSVGEQDLLLADWITAQPGLFVPLGERAVPFEHYVVVMRKALPGEAPRTATGVYMEFAATRYFGSLFHLSAVAIILIIVSLWFLGRLVNARIGGWVVNKFESQILGRLPVIRNVYGSVKQVTDFLFSENQVEYRRVVAIEYPRRGIWSLGLVTGDSMLDISAAVGEPCVSVLIPSSPMPVTGYTMSVPRSHVLDLDITVDQAMQFCISCGVVVPAHQRATPELLQEHLNQRFSEEFVVAGATRTHRSEPRLHAAGEDSEDPSSWQSSGSEPDQ